MDQSSVTLERMRCFVRVVERGSLSAVARELGIGQSTVTRQLRELEAALGIRLISRTTRRLAVTDEGRRYYADCLEILRRVERAGEAVRDRSSAAEGRIRISCTAALGVLHVTRLVFAFQDRHPGIEIDLGLTDERIDLVREGVDLALRLGPLADSALRLRTLGQSGRLLVAAPGYLAARGRPRVPEDLAEHEGVRMTNVAGSDTLVLAGPDGARHAVAFGGRLRVDHGLAAREAFVAGRGIGPTHHWLVADHLAAGRLEQVLPEYRLSAVPLSLLIVPERAEIGRVRLLVDYLAASVATIPGIVTPRPGPAARLATTPLS